MHMHAYGSVKSSPLAGEADRWPATDVLRESKQCCSAKYSKLHKHSRVPLQARVSNGRTEEPGTMQPFTDMPDMSQACQAYTSVNQFGREAAPLRRAGHWERKIASYKTAAGRVNESFVVRWLTVWRNEDDLTLDRVCEGGLPLEIFCLLYGTMLCAARHLNSASLTYTVEP